MRSGAQYPIITFPVLIEARVPTHPRIAVVAPRKMPDPRRMTAAELSRTRRAPPPVEDDTIDTYIGLATVIFFLAVIW